MSTSHTTAPPGELANRSGRPGFLSGLRGQGRFNLLPMVIVLIVVWGALEAVTGGLFLSPRNLTNLSGRVAITAILAAGAMIVMIPGYIDLSLGATVAASAGVAAYASAVFNFSFGATVAITLGFGLVIGLWHAFWIAWMGVPAFIVTLASLLAIRGVSLIITNAETISPSNAMLVISDSSLSPELSIAFLVAFWAVFSLLQVREWRAQRAAGLGSSFAAVVGIPAVSLGVVMLGAVVVAGSYLGIPMPDAILLGVLAITGLILRYTAFGRRLFAIGGNRLAAQLAGIDIRLHASLVFAGMGLLYGLSGLVLVARLDSAPPAAERGLELDVIAAAVIGGTSLLGGRGTIAGAFIGAVLMESLANGMSLMNLPSAYPLIAVGLVLPLAVYADIRGRGAEYYPKTEETRDMEGPFEVARLRPPAALLEKIRSGCRFTEGAVYFADHRCLLFSDVPSSRMYRWDEETGQVTTFRANSNFSNGNTRDSEGRLVTCEHQTRRVTRTEIDGSVTVLAERWQGKRFNSPNDVVVKSDGTIWFTDPRYGLDQYYEGGRGESEIGSCNVYRLDPRDGSIEKVVDDFSRPNGLAFSADESKLYIVDSGLFPDPNGPHHIRVFDVTDEGRLRGGRVLIEVSPGIPDGLRLDTEGNLWCSAGDGVHCITSEGELIGKIRTPEICANVVFGGPRRNRLFLCAYTSIYAIYVEAIGAQRP